MLVELWERLRGYNKWPSAQATVTTSNVNRAAHYARNGDVDYSYSSKDQIEWVDFHGQKQSSAFRVPDDSPLYQFVGGETIQIHYDPGNPRKFYCRDLLQTRINTARKLALYTLGILVVLLALFSLNVWTHGH